MYKAALSIALVFATSLPAKPADFEFVSWNGHPAVQLSGVIDSGTAARFSDVLARAVPADHGLPILLLNSPGGSVTEALLMSQIMDAFPVHTVIPDGAECASACGSILFIAGRYRTMDHFGRLGQHSCSQNGVRNAQCNEVLAQHAMRHGVSHGSVAAFVNYASPDDMVWLDREFTDGWGISHYPGSEAVGFEKSEPRVIGVLTGRVPVGQPLWRLDFWGDGWRAFTRPARDDERALQINVSCSGRQPGNLLLTAEVIGHADFIRSLIIDADLHTEAFSITGVQPTVTQIDVRATAVTLNIPRENVMPFLTEATSYRYSINVRPPYDTIWASGNISNSRVNLLFAANHCSS